MSEDSSSPILISISDLKAAYSGKREGMSAVYQRKIKEKLDTILEHDEWEADDIIEYSLEHNYALSPILDCIIYYVTGFTF